MSRHLPPCVCRKCGMNHAAPPNPAWRYSPPKSGRIRVDVRDARGQVIGQKVVAVVELDANAIAEFLPAPDPRA